MLKNSSTRFGSLTKLLHWTIFAVFCIQYYLIWERSLFPENAPERTPLIITHKAFGMAALGLGLLFWIWKAINVKPALPYQAQWERVLTKVVQHSLLLLMVLMPLSGYLLSCSAGRATEFFGLFTFPMLISPNKALLSFFANTHEVFAYLIGGLVSLHVLGALRHHFFIKDNVLKRMLPFTRT